MVLAIVETIAEYKRSGSVSSPPKKWSRPNITQKLPDEQIGEIRKHILGFWERNELPTLAKVLVAINEEENLSALSPLGQLFI